MSQLRESMSGLAVPQHIIEMQLTSGKVAIPSHHWNFDLTYARDFYGNLVDLRPYDGDSVVTLDSVDDRPRRRVPLTRGQVADLVRCWRNGARVSSELSSWENYVFLIEAGGSQAVLRISEASRRLEWEVLAELDFLKYLRVRSVAVPENLPFDSAANQPLNHRISAGEQRKGAQ